MALKKIGASIVLEGEKEYRNALKNINSEQKELKSEMELASAQYKEQQNSLEALQAKYEVLTKQIEAQSKKVDVYNTALEEARKVQENAASNVDKYKEELAQAETELEKMKNSSSATTEEIQQQEKVVAELAGKLDESNASYDKATQQVGYWQTGLNNAQAVLIGLERELENNNQYMKEAEENSDHCATSIDEFGKRVKDTEDNVSKFGEIMLGNFASDVVIKGLETMVDLIGKAGEGLLDLASNTAFYADDVNTMSKVTGVATDTIQALQYSEKLLDVSVNTVTQSMARNVRSMQNAASGSENYADAYKKIGVAVTDANGELRNSEEVFWDVIDALGKMQNATERDATAMQLFGRNAQQLNPLIMAGSAGFKELKKEAEGLGYVLDQETLDALNDTSDGFERLSKYGDVIKKEIGASMADTVADALERIQKAIEANEDDIKGAIETVIPALANGLIAVVENLDVIVPLLAGLGAGFVAFKVAPGIMAAMSAAMKIFSLETEGATIKQNLLNMAMNANPVLLLITAFTALGTALATYAGMAGKAKDESLEMLDAMSKEAEEEKKAIESRKRAREEQEKNVTIATRLKNELADLNDREKLSNEEKTKMKQIVQELNGIYPDLNLSLNEETGHLEQTNEELEREIENQRNLMMLEAAKNDLQNIATDRYEAEKNYNQILEEREEWMQRVNTLQEQVNTAMENGEAVMTATWGDQELTMTTSLWIDMLGSLNDVTEKYNILAAEEQSTMEKLDEEYSKVSGSLDSYSGKVQSVEDAYRHNIDTVVEWKDKQVLVTQEVADKLGELKTTYDNVKQSAKESLEGQIGLFDELSNKSDLTVKQMASNLNQQTDVINTYADDMMTAKELVERGLMDEGLLGELQEMGISGAGYLHELVTSAENDLPAFQAAMDAWTNQQEALDNLASTLAEMETSYTETMDNIVRVADELPENLEEPQKETVDGFETMISTIEEVFKNSVPTIGENGKLLGVSALQGSKDALGIGDDGTSSEGMAIGQAYAESMASGISAYADSVYSAIDAITAEANERAKSAVEDINRTLGGMM